MYFNERKSNTNIDKEFKKKKKKKNNILSSILSFIKKYKKIILFSVLVFFSILMVIFFALTKNDKSGNDIIINDEVIKDDTVKEEKITNYLILNGDKEVTIHKGVDYIESGFLAYNSNNEDMSSSVIVESTLNINQVGEYQIVYKLGDLTEVRKIIVVEKPRGDTHIYLNSVGDSVNLFLKVNEKYVEPGYKAFSTYGGDLTKNVKVSGVVDTTKKGSYTLVYSLVTEDNVTISASRIVNVIDLDINLSLVNQNYTNDSVNIDVLVDDDYFNYLVLPDNTKVNSKQYSYKVTENGKYTFTSYNTMGMSKQSTIEVNNIDRVGPNGSCTLVQNTNNSTIFIEASDDHEIDRYVYNGKDYKSNNLTVSAILNSAKITIYDTAGNSKDVTCSVTPKVYINDIKKDGVIITVNAKKVNNNIKGYYFSYNSTRPNKNTGGYLETSNTSVDVVRLPGTTYVWVEDTSGKISSYKTVTIGNDALFITTGSEYKILKNTRLDTFLKNQGWSLTELNKLINRSALAAGLYTKTAAATSAVALQLVLAQKYQIRLPYWWGGKSWSFGADGEWGEYRYKINENTGKEYLYDGLDCTGFTTWAYVNAGYDIGSVTNKYGVYFDAWWKNRIDFNQGEIGDFLVYNNDRNNRHAKLIIGKTSNGYITAESSGGNTGMIINTHLFSKAGNYKVEKAELLMDDYEKIPKSKYPKGF